ncbi:MAG: EVE domain-containing protein [Gammaproteobacteria bacterium]|nr:EVE domain-containing protein [Gammaproteobacteria bacterium]MDH3465892.1 EVE domain-containing protein [Gammaproteobacteria bacterium]
MKHWLMKSEPSAYSVDDLAAQPNKTDHWDGIRNYQARNFMRDDMKIGDLAFFYHSSCAEPGIVGIMEVVRAAYSDDSALDSKSDYFDPKATAENTRWVMVDVRLKRKLKRPISLQELKSHKALTGMPLLQRGARLSIMPVTKKQWDYIIKLSDR